jgi:hypothetical protein
LSHSFNVQPQVQAFKLFNSPLQKDSDRLALLAKSETIRQGLVNANLFRYRYGYAWEIKQDSNKKTSTTGFEAIAARELALSLSQKLNDSSVTELDSIHAIALFIISRHKAISAK